MLVLSERPTDGLSDNTNTAAKTIKNLSIYKVNLSNRKNQQAMLGYMHELISRSLSGLVTKHDLMSGNETSKPRLPENHSYQTSQYPYSFTSEKQNT